MAQHPKGPAELPWSSSHFSLVILAGVGNISATYILCRIVLSLFIKEHTSE